MTCGKHNNLYTRMRESNPDLVLVKCLPLPPPCLNEAVDVLPTQIDSLVQETLKWISQSPKWQEFYKAIYAPINYEFMLRKLVGVSTTQWPGIAPALRAVLSQQLELKMHFDAARTAERCYLAKMLSEMYNDEQNFLYVQFLSPIVIKLLKINKLFQSESPDQSKLFEDLNSFVHVLPQRIIFPSHASTDSDWQGNLLHVRACHMRSIFREALEKSSLCEEKKAAILEWCCAFLVECIMNVLKCLPSNINF